MVDDIVEYLPTWNKKTLPNAVQKLQNGLIKSIVYLKTSNRSTPLGILILIEIDLGYYKRKTTSIFSKILVKSLLAHH